MQPESFPRGIKASFYIVVRNNNLCTRVVFRIQYGLKKKVEETPFGAPDPGEDGRLTRKKKTPEEMLAEKNKEEEEEGLMEILCYKCFQM